NCVAADVGTGSGILAIYLAKSGARRVFAIDIDPDIVAAAKENFVLNRVEQRVEALMCPLDQLEGGELDVIVANLTPSVLFGMIGTMASKLDPEGTLVLSGYKVPLQAKVHQLATQYGLEPIQSFVNQGWSAETFAFRR
ncbi:MAG: methyltransferase domain-containing protein, partial [Thermodesulfobacteria bacterium]|nr:methyltransferase domain-containing protein [Thermodesulfobacteriota bacterium]